MVDRTTVVTAFYPLARSKHGVARYHTWIQNFCRLNCQLVVYTDDSQKNMFATLCPKAMVVARPFDSWQMTSPAMMDFWRPLRLRFPLYGQSVIQTLIFDEVDSGVGGAVAETVGRLMKQLGRDRQVMAVTHLPQVAACADNHWVVYKQSDKQGSFSAVETVTGEQRVSEIARMLGGERLSDTTHAHAREMLQAMTTVSTAKAKPRAAKT